MVIASSHALRVPTRPALASPPEPSDRFVASEAAPPDLRELARSFTPRPLDSIEFKLLLDPQHLVDEGVDRFWDVIQDAADTAGLDTRKEDDDPKRRVLEYLDTKDFALKERGYILRSRTAGKAKPVLALKFRNEDRARVAGADVHSDLDGEGKFEKDVTPRKDLYAKSYKVKLKDLPDEDLKEFAKVFPPLGELGISPLAHLVPVQGRRIEEEVHELGTVGECPVRVSVWYEDDHPVIAECSFGLAPEHEADGARLMKALQGQAAAWLSSGGATKTEWVYSAKR